MVGRWGYFVQAAAAGMVRARGLTTASTLTLASALFVMGAFGMALHHGRALARAWGQGGHISCAIAAFVPQDQWPALQQTVARLPGVKEVQLVTPEQAIEQFCARGPSSCALVEGVDPALLPAALHVIPAASMVSQKDITELARSMQAIAGIEDVAYGEAKLEQVRAAMRTGALLALVLAALLLGAMVFMVANTIRLMIHARQDEVRILRLVGATAWFVRAPFMLEGLSWGLAAGLLSAAALRGVDGLFAKQLLQAQAILGHPEPLRLFAWTMLWVQMVTGAGLGLMGSFVALHRYLDEDVG